MAYIFKREPLTGDEADKLVNACDTFQEKLVVWTLLDTGLREFEFVGIKKGNIDWQRGTIVIWGKGGIHGKASKRRLIPMTERVKTLLLNALTLYDPNVIPFSTKTVQRIVKKVANKAMITRKCSPHVLRHTFAVLSLQRGISLATLKLFMGHDRLQTTEIYLNMHPDEAIAEFRRKIG